MDSDEEQIENVEETSRGDSDDELVIDKVNICLLMNLKLSMLQSEQQASNSIFSAGR